MVRHLSFENDLPKPRQYLLKKLEPRRPRGDAASAQKGDSYPRKKSGSDWRNPIVGLPRNLEPHEPFTGKVPW
jgi:hypothetical protein